MQKEEETPVVQDLMKPSDSVPSQPEYKFVGSVDQDGNELESGYDADKWYITRLWILIDIHIIKKWIIIQEIMMHFGMDIQIMIGLMTKERWQRLLRK